MNKNFKGLSEKEVLDNQNKYGNNEIIEKKRKNFFLIFIHEFNDWLIIILLIAALVGIIVDRDSLFETFIIILILLINATIGAIQEVKAFKTLEGLKKLSNHKTKVIRNSKIIEIEPKYLTIDDIVLLEKGNLIDADMIVLESNDLSIDESILTGESISIDKRINDFLSSGTYIIRGNGIGKVRSIGMKSKLGEIAGSLIDVEKELTPIEEKLAGVGKIIGLISIIICIFIFVIELLLGYTLIDSFKSAVSLAVAAIPEGLATVVTVCLAIGVSRMAKENVIIKRLACVETLGCSNVICTDKTGTLTENKLKVINIYENRLYKKDEFNKISDSFLKYLAILSKTEILNLDPVDLAIEHLLKELNYNFNDYQIKQVTPFNSEAKYMSVKVLLINEQITIYKGAIEVISKICATMDENALKNANIMMDKGYRVIAIATKDKFLGLLGMQDLPKNDVINSISLAKRAGIKTVMITGDHPKTAFMIAEQLNIASDSSEVITKEEFDLLTEKQLEENVTKYSVYARVSPSDKAKIVKAWQKRDMVVAMTGDGINDAIALKNADIGCAMESGAEISKNSSDLIIVDNNYNSIVKAVKNGRSIYENIKKCCKYLLSSNIGEVLTILVISLLSLILNINLGIPLLPIHLLWINVITDSLPAFGLGIMHGTSDLMKIPPRNKKDSFFDKRMIKDILFMGFIIGFLTIIAYFIGLRLNPIYAQTMAFFTISTSQLFHSYNCSSNRSILNNNLVKNKFLNISFIVGLLLQILVLYSPKISILFKLKPLPMSYLIICILLAFSTIVFNEILKRFTNK